MHTLSEYVHKDIDIRIRTYEYEYVHTCTYEYEHEYEYTHYMNIHPYIRTYVSSPSSPPLPLANKRETHM